uniref:Cadherin domain-containing protein n=1 Tax=Steinernema glaseri TaxID=37863 RepID=A0A1I8A7X0_9BILA
EGDSHLKPLYDPETGNIAGFNGHSSLIGDFELDFVTRSKEDASLSHLLFRDAPFVNLDFVTRSKEDAALSHLLFRDAPFVNVGHLKEIIERSFTLEQHDDQVLLKLVEVHEDRQDDAERPNFIAIQLVEVHEDRQDDAERPNFIAIQVTMP